MRAVEPTPYHDCLALRIDPHGVAARAEHEPTRARCIGEHAPITVEPCEPAVEWSDGAGGLHLPHPLAAIQQQLADAGLVARADAHAAAPVRAARHRLHSPPVDLHP